MGRYAWDMQPQIANWNLTRLAETLLPLLDEDEKKASALAEERLSDFATQFPDVFQTGLWAKLGLAENTVKSRQFTADTLTTMAEDEIDFTIFSIH